MGVLKKNWFNADFNLLQKIGAGSVPSSGEILSIFLDGVHNIFAHCRAH